MLNPASEPSYPVFNKLTWREPAIQSEYQLLVSDHLHKNLYCDLDEL